MSPSAPAVRPWSTRGARSSTEPARGRRRGVRRRRARCERGRRGRAVRRPKRYRPRRPTRIVGLERDRVRITNCVRCRPPENRDPTKDELANCRGYLEAELDRLDPEVIVTLGKVPSEHLLERSVAVTKEAGTLEDVRIEGTPAAVDLRPSGGDAVRSEPGGDVRRRSRASRGPGRRRRRRERADAAGRVLSSRADSGVFGLHVADVSGFYTPRKPRSISFPPVSAGRSDHRGVGMKGLSASGRRTKQARDRRERAQRVLRLDADRAFVVFSSPLPTAERI